MVLLGIGERSTHARVWTQQSFHFNFIFLFPHEWVYESNFIIAAFSWNKMFEGGGQSVSLERDVG